MAGPSQFHVPGAFHADDGIHTSFFRPPISPISPASSLGQLPEPQPNPALETRMKRRLRDADSHAAAAGAHDNNDNTDDDHDMTTPAGRAYTLAGQLHTPGPNGPGDNGILGESIYSDSDYRRLLGTKRRRDDDDADGDGPGPTPLFHLPPQPTPARPGWGSLAVHTLGEVVGRVWDFCKGGGFKGFHAGGGAGFDMETTGAGGVMSQPQPQLHSVDESAMMDTSGSIVADGEGHRVPGWFPQPQHRPAAMSFPSRYSNDASDASRQPSAKRRQTDQPDDLGRSWVMVREPQAGVASPRRPPYRSSPRNRNQGPAVTTGRRISTPTARLSSTPNRRLSSARVAQGNSPAVSSLPRPTSSASFASPRSPSPSKIPKATGSFSNAQPTPSRRRSAAPGHEPRQGISHRRTHSGASTASNRGGGDDDGAAVSDSPRLDAEAKKLAARRRAEERDADFRIAAFNNRLQDMIRQGKEALGTTVEVGGGEGGWEDED